MCVVCVCVCVCVREREREREKERERERERERAYVCLCVCVCVSGYILFSFLKLSYWVLGHFQYSKLILCMLIELNAVYVTFGCFYFLSL